MSLLLYQLSYRPSAREPIQADARLWCCPTRRAVRAGHPPISSSQPLLLLLISVTLPSVGVMAASRALRRAARSGLPVWA